MRTQNSHYLLLRYCKSTLRDLRRLVNKVSEEVSIRDLGYLHSFHYRNERNLLLDQITRILKEYNGIAEISLDSGYEIESRELEILKNFLLEIMLLTEHLSIQISVIEQERKKRF